ncbi:MAG: HAMP domain-containing histidine kinase [Bifidobacteriaceae bacterium]|jgi:signal transduction histidine kinase|nr:HAMP domain-containing histidine kinase [Bifidobacteriaceae bacterium]
MAKSRLVQKDLISNVSHELRTPVSILKAQLENLADGIDKPTPALFEQMLDTTNQMSDLIEFFLDLSRLQEGKQFLNLSVFKIGDYLEECISSLTYLTRAKNIQFIIDVQPADLSIMADKNRLRQIVINLVTNAIKYSLGTSKIIIQVLQDGKNNLIRFIDFGPGIPKKTRKKLFARFTRGDISQQGGTGLGLAISQWAATLHKGKLDILDSKEGAIFELKFPKNF